MTRALFNVVADVPLSKLLLDTKNPRIRAGGPHARTRLPA